MPDPTLPPCSADRCPRILLVDDNPLDVELTLLGLAEHQLEQQVSVVSDGMEALEFLHRTGRHAQRPPGLPVLVLLDLNMPGLRGQEVLADIRNDPALHHLCVVILTTSERPEDRAACVKADAYLIKPLNPEAFTQKVGNVIETLLLHP